MTPSQGTTHRLSRPVPPGATVVVGEGDRLEADAVIARGLTDKRVLRLPAGGNFEILKKPGDPVKAGETVAVAEEFFGLGLRELVSPFDGVFDSVNEQRTALVLAGSDAEIRALVPGVVKKLSPLEIELEVKAHRIKGHFGFGRPTAAELWPAGELITEHEVRRRIGPEVEGRIVLADSYVLAGAIPALARYGAAGLICGGLDFKPLWDLISPDGPYPAGLGLPALVVTEGFGSSRIDPETRRVLARAEGRTIYMAGPATGRLVFAGPPYPEVLVPED